MKNYHSKGGFMQDQFLEILSSIHDKYENLKDKNLRLLEKLEKQEVLTFCQSFMNKNKPINDEANNKLKGYKND